MLQRFSHQLKQWGKHWQKWSQGDIQVTLEYSSTETNETVREDMLFRVQVELPRIVSREAAYRQRLQAMQQRRLHAFARKLWLKKTGRRTHNKFLRLLPGIFITLGSVILANAVWPIASYLVFTSPSLQVAKLVSPLPDLPIVRQTHTVASAQAVSADVLKPKIIRDNLDYTNLNNWFPQGTDPLAASEEDMTEVKEYSISIPSLDIENALVKIGGTDLDENLVQYPGTADPGDYGAPVIFGHSVLRQFYNPSVKNPRRYISIFSKIMTMKPGEKIYVDIDGIRYTYSVVKKVEVKPEDTYILEQEYSARQLKLITCVPEGTYLRRGVLLAQLETIGEKE